MTPQRAYGDAIGGTVAGMEEERKLWTEVFCPLGKLTAEGVAASGPLTGQLCTTHSDPRRRVQEACGVMQRLPIPGLG